MGTFNPLSGLVSAAPIPEIDQDAIRTDTVEYLPNIPGANCSVAPGTTATGSLADGSSVYILGDSITVRAEKDYTKAFSAKGIAVSMSAVSGRSWTEPGNPAQGAVGTRGPAQSAVDKDTEVIKASKGIVIALGTNNYLTQNPVDDIYAKIRSINPAAPIWWVNVANAPPGNSSVPGFNAKLDQTAPGKFTVIPWAKTVDPDGDGTHNPKGILEDLTHPWVTSPAHPLGTQTLAELVVAAVSGQGTVSSPNPTASVTSCSCPADGASNLTGSDNEEKAYNYFVSKGLQPFQAAGVIGNLMRESNLTPDLYNTTGSGAYGIGQWLGDRLGNMRKWVTDQGKDPKTFDPQLEFLYFESSQRVSLSFPGTKEWEGLKKTTDIQDAVVYWEKNFERAQDKPEGIAQRVAFANKTMTKYGSNAPTSSSGTPTCGTAGQATATTFNYEDTARGRKLKTTVYVPSGAGPFPIVMFAHGFEKGPDAYTRYIQAIASKGFIVVAPSFPNADEHGIVPLNRDDSLPKQPADISYVLGQVLNEGQIKDKVKAGAIGIVGHSDGAIDALRVGYGPQKDARFKVIVAVASDDISGELGSGPALLQLHGDKDTIANLGGDLNNFKKITASPKYFYTMLGADHFAVVATGTDDTPALDALTVGFLDQLLNGKSDTMNDIAGQFNGKVKKE